MTAASAPLRILVIAPLRFPIRPPHAGGLEAAVWSEVSVLRRRGHAVDLIAVEGSDFVVPGSAFEIPGLDWPEHAIRTDTTYPESYEGISVPALDRALGLIAAEPERWDAISNHCLHPLPLQRAPHLGVPMVTTLHTPVEPEFVAAHRAAGGAGSAFLSVSDHTRGEWSGAGVSSRLLPNGVDPQVWREGPGGPGLVWFGRVVPEKAPHLAVAVARRMGLPITIAGRIGDRDYAERMLFPLLGDDARYAGALEPAALAELVATSGVALSTPAWEEPFGLVAPEALLCGTPVVSFAVGGVPEIAAGSEGMAVVPAGDLDAMAARAAALLAATEAEPGLRHCIRARALARFSIEARAGELERIFGGLAAARLGLTA